MFSKECYIQKSLEIYFSNLLGFHQLIRSVAKGGNIIRFSKDKWLRDSSFKDLYPSLFQISSLHDKPISQFIQDEGSRLNSSLSWVLHFRRDLRDEEMNELSSLLQSLENVRLDVDGIDIKVSKVDSSGSFSVKSFNESLFPISVFPLFPSFKSIWKVPIPHKVQVFSWTVAQGNSIWS